MSSACGTKPILVLLQLWTRLWCWKSGLSEQRRVSAPPGAPRPAGLCSSARPFYLDYFPCFQPPRFSLSLCMRGSSFPLWLQQIASLAQAERRGANLRRGHQKPLGAALWMIWYTRRGYSSVDALMSADYCRFEGRGIWKRAFQRGTKPGSNWNSLCFPWVGVRVKQLSKERSENFISTSYFWDSVLAWSVTSQFYGFYLTKARLARPRLCARLHRGDCNKLQFFCAGRGIQNQACVEEPLTSRPSLPTTNTFFYFPPPSPHSLSLSLSLPFLAQRESLEKKRGFYSGSPCAPLHSQAFWNLSMACQAAPRVQLALCEDFLSAAAAAAPPEAARALSLVEGLSSHDWV